LGSTPKEEGEELEKTENEEELQDNKSVSEENEKPKAILIAKKLKNNDNKLPLQRKAKLGDGSHIAAEDR
jgi:hypothetical protein